MTVPAARGHRNLVRARLNRLAAAALVAAGTAVSAQGDVQTMLQRIGDSVRRYYGRAQSIICMERVVVQQIGSDMSPQGFARTIDYELRVEWEGGADGVPLDATVNRVIRKINGRAPRPGDEPKCLDPRSISPEPLAFLLPGKRDDYFFSLGRPGRDRSRQLVTLDFESRPEGPMPPEAVATKADQKGKDEDCLSFSFPVDLKGRVWLDPETHDIVRVDQSLKHGFEVRIPPRVSQNGVPDRFVVSRYDSSVRYRPVTFLEPEETILLPESISEVMVVTGGSRAGKRITQTYSDYKRFITGGRVVK
jgi:hypothetical protein